MVREGRNRIVIKEGDPDISSIVALYNLYKYAERRGVYDFTLTEIEKDLLSPQKVFCMSSKKVESLITKYAYDNLLILDSDFNSLKIVLRKDLSSLNILEKYVRGEIT